MIIKNKYYSQIEIFKLWLEENKDRFICKPIIFEESSSYLAFKYNNIIENILVRVDNNSSVNVRVENMVGMDCVDLLADFLVVLNTDDNDKYYNEALSEQERVYYDIPEPVYYDEYNLFLKWSNKMISQDNFLYLYNNSDKRYFAKIQADTEIHTVDKEDKTRDSISQVISLNKVIK